MQTILIQQQPNTETECSTPGEDRHLYATGAAEPSTPCDDTAADADRVPITGALPQSAKGEVPAQLFVLQFLVAREERSAAESAVSVRHTSETSDVWSATETESKEPGTGVPTKEA